MLETSTLAGQRRGPGQARQPVQGGAGQPGADQWLGARGIHPAPDANRPGFGVVVVPVRFVSAAALAPLLQPFAPPGGSLQVDPERNLLLLAGTLDELSTLTDLVASSTSTGWPACLSGSIARVRRATELLAELQQTSRSTSGRRAGCCAFSDPAAQRGARDVEPAGLSGPGRGLGPAPRPGRRGGRAPGLRLRGADRPGDRSGPGPGRDLQCPERRGRPPGSAGTGLQPASIGPSLLAASRVRAAPWPSRARQARPLLRCNRRARPAWRRSRPARPDRQPGWRRPAARPRRPAVPAGDRPVDRPAGGPGAGPGDGHRDPDHRRFDHQVVGDLGEPARLSQDQEGARPARHLAAPRADRGNGRRGHAQQRAALRGRMVPAIGQFLGGSSRGALPRRRCHPCCRGSRRCSTATTRRWCWKRSRSATRNVDVVSSPHLLVLDNQTARIQVGDQVPITVQQATSVTNPEAPIVNSIELRDTGVILSATPRVNASGLVVMELQQEVSNVARSAQQTTTSEQSKRRPSPSARSAAPWRSRAARRSARWWGRF